MGDTSPNGCFFHCHVSFRGCNPGGDRFISIYSIATPKQPTKVKFSWICFCWWFFYGLGSHGMKISMFSPPFGRRCLVHFIQASNGQANPSFTGFTEGHVVGRYWILSLSYLWVAWSCRKSCGKLGGFWWIIPISQWLITIVSRSPNWGCSLFKWPFHGL